MNNLSMPANVIRHLKQSAPLSGEIENGGRRFGQYYDSSEGGRGYKDFCIYVQNGLAGYTELFKEIASGLFKLNNENYGNCRIYIFGFGTGTDLLYDNNCIISGYWSDKSMKDKMIKALVRISGANPVKPAFLPRLIPETGIGNYFTRKSRIESSDLLIIIGKDKEVYLDNGLSTQFSFKLKKRILQVSVEQSDVHYNIKDQLQFSFDSLENLTNNTNMKTTTFYRNATSSLTSILLNDPLYSHLDKDLRAGKVFPAIRNEVIDFYHKGGRLFCFDKNGFKTHIKYAAVIEKQGKDYLTEKELKTPLFVPDFSTNYGRIKENCSNYSGIEASGVAELYHKYSYVSSNENVVVLDIEVSFQSLDYDSTQDRIDILLLNKKEQKLKFVEAKHYSNPEIWSESIAKVVSQISKYENQIMQKRSEIIDGYNNYINIVNQLFSCSLPSVLDLDEKVTLLIFGFDSDQENGRLKKWITGKDQDHPAKSNPFKSNKIVIYKKGDIKSLDLKNLWNKK